MTASQDNPEATDMPPLTRKAYAQSYTNLMELYDRAHASYVLSRDEDRKRVIDKRGRKVVADRKRLHTREVTR